MSHNFAERTSPYTKFVRDVPGRKSEQRMVGNGDSCRGGAPPARVAVPGHPLLWFPTRDVAQKFK